MGIRSSKRYACHRLAGGEPLEIVAHADKAGSSTSQRLPAKTQMSTAK
jgi:hypothetical protein